MTGRRRGLLASLSVSLLVHVVGALAILGLTVRHEGSSVLFVDLSEAIVATADRTPVSGAMPRASEEGLAPLPVGVATRTRHAETRHARVDTVARSTTEPPRPRPADDPPATPPRADETPQPAARDGEKLRADVVRSESAQRRDPARESPPPERKVTVVESAAGALEQSAAAKSQAPSFATVPVTPPAAPTNTSAAETPVVPTVPAPVTAMPASPRTGDHAAPAETPAAARRSVRASAPEISSASDARPAPGETSPKPLSRTGGTGEVTGKPKEVPTPGDAAGRIPDETGRRARPASSESAGGVVGAAAVGAKDGREGGDSPRAGAPSSRGEGHVSEGGAAKRAAAAGGGADQSRGDELALALPGPGGVGTEYAPYLGRLRTRIHEALRYPMAARRRGLAGTVQIEIVVLPSGAIGRATVVESSSHRLLDAAALAAVRDLAPIPFPEDVPPRTLRVRLPVVFALQ